MPMAQPCLKEAPWSIAELKRAIARVKAKKAADDALLHLFRTVLLIGEVPQTWKRSTLFNMLPKTRRAKSTSDFRPIAAARLLYSYTKHLHIWCWVGWSHFWARDNQENSMDSEPINASKKTCLQQSLCLTKPFHLMCQCGLWVWICQRHLSRSNET